MKVTDADITEALKTIERWESSAKLRKDEKARAKCRLIAEVIRALAGR